MEKLNKKEKHKHLFTNILKGSIFAIVMLAPMFSVLTRCLYVVCNPNAKDSYSDSYIIKTQQITNASQMVSGSDYIATYTSTTGNNVYGAWITYNSISIDWTDYDFEDATYNQFRLFQNGIVQLKDTDNTQYQKSNIWGRTLNQFTFNLKELNTESFLNGGVIYTGLFYQQNKLDNAFEYSIEQLKESSMYNWAENTAIYQGLYDMCTSMGTNDVIPLLLAYWALLTAIYIVFDIIIWCFTKITHFVSAD